MKIINWFKKQITTFVLATASVEKNAFKQNNESLTTSVTQEQRHKQGMLSDALKRGEITQEVKDLRWRMYKIIKATDSVIANITGYDEDGLPIVEVIKKSKKIAIRKNIRVDKFDDYEVLMVVNNSEIMLGISEGSNIDKLESVDGEIRIDDNGDSVKTIGDVSFNEYISNVKSDRPINVQRDIKSKFNIEDYTKKMVVRKISSNERLLEFYISMYPDEYNRNSRLLISELKKAQNNPRASNIFDIKSINYITNNTIGTYDYELYEYNNIIFDKMIEFDGHYVIKFRANLLINGEDIINKFREIDLDKKYETKEKK